MSDEPSPTGSASASRTGLRRRQETLLSVLRRFSRLWGFLIFAVLVVYLFRGIALPFVFAMLLAYLLRAGVFLRAVDSHFVLLATNLVQAFVSDSGPV